MISSKEVVSIKIEESDVDNRILVYENGILYISISGDGWMYKEVFDSKYNKINKLFYNTTLNRDYNLLEFESHYWNNYEWN